MSDALPVVVIGAGPIGLAAAAHLPSAACRSVVLEQGADRRGRGPRLGPRAAVLAVVASWSTPPPGGSSSPPGGPRPTRSATRPAPTGPSSYLQPLADALGVGAATTPGSPAWPARGATWSSTPAATTRRTPCTSRRPAGAERDPARAVIDASGTWSTTNPLGADGYPALGEARARRPDRLPHPRPGRPGRARAGTPASTSSSPAPAPRPRPRWSPSPQLAERGAGHPGRPGCVRRPAVGHTFGGGADDQLAARGALGHRARPRPRSERRHHP